MPFWEEAFKTGVPKFQKGKEEPPTGPPAGALLRHISILPPVKFAQGEITSSEHIRQKEGRAAPGGRKQKRRTSGKMSLFWYARLDSNQRPTESESVTLSN